GKNYLYIPHGPVVDFSNAQSAKPEAIEKFTTGHGPEMLTKNFQVQVKNEVDNFMRYLKKLAREEKSIFVKMEPASDVVTETIFRKGMKRSKKEIQPAKSVILDLFLPEDELLARMHHKTRYNIRLAEKKGLWLEESTDVETFWKLLQKTAKKDKFYTHEKSYYEKLLSYFAHDREKNTTELSTLLFFVYYKDKPIAGAIVMSYGDTAYYLHGAMDRSYKELMAPYALHWENIKFLKQKGFKYYDLWGIDAQKWPGVTRFKLGWGGDTKEYPGSFDIPVSKFWYLMYNLARKVF
ncbi:MAG: peptidoglycan bridge formation glycyltransferase FemA/FemB family protein, partial [Candidatus Yanofskybacteria bacterium]|nr:peptidoglycan bridge formation glycyltransferase FemA/FemB family protein [Candidatus Yanofskybacteria bacterium]